MTDQRRPLRVGMVCSLLLDVPGGAADHVLGLEDHDVTSRPSLDALVFLEFVLDRALHPASAWSACHVPDNGSQPRELCGLLSAARVRRWLRAAT